MAPHFQEALPLLSHFTSILKRENSDDEKKDSTLILPPAKENLEGEDDGDGEDQSDQDHNQHACPGTGNHLQMWSLLLSVSLIPNMSAFVNEIVVQETRKHFYQKIFDTNFFWINNGDFALGK